MNVLLDECVPWPLAKHLPGHQCFSVCHCGWAGIKNGQLLALAEARFDLFITSDQNIEYQQNLKGRRIAILELSTNNLRRIITAIALMQAAVASIRPGEYHRLDIP
jgi:hypothetical protein